MRDKIRIKSDGKCWVMTIPGFGFSPFVTLKFTKWSDAIAYLDWQPSGSSSSFERAYQSRDAIGTTPEWTPLQQW